MKIFRAKTYYSCIEALAQEIASRGNSPEIDNVVFTEEKNTLLTERAIAFATGGTFNTRVLSMRRFLKTAAQAKGLLSKQGSVMLVRRIVGENAEKLKCFNKVRFKTLAPTVYELIAQLKSAKVGVGEFSAAAEEAGGILGEKLRDLALLYSAYESEITARGYKDQSNYLADLPSVIDKGALDGADVFFCAYASMTRLEAETVRAALRRAKSVTAFLVDGENRALYTGETMGIFRKIALENGCGYTVTEIPERGASAAGTELLFLPVRREKREGNVYFYEAGDPEDELEYVAETIKCAVLDGKIRYRDAEIEIPDEYVRPAARVLAEYGVPCFIDVRKKLSEHSLTRLVVDYFEAYRRGFSYKEVIAFAKNPVLCPDGDFGDRFENFCLRYGVDRGGFFKPFAHGKDNPERDAFEEFRANLASLFGSMKRRAGAAYYSGRVKALLEKIGARERVSALDEKLSACGEAEQAAFGAQAYDRTLAVLEETEKVLGDAEIDADEYEAILTSGFAADELAVLPQYADAVYVGGFREIRLVKAKYLFLTGLTSDVPAAKSDVAMLSDADLDRLERLKIVVEPKIRTVNRRERENVGLAASSFSERLYVSYAVTGPDGRAQTKSELIAWLATVYSLKRAERDPRGERRYLTEAQAEKRFARDVCEFFAAENADWVGNDALPFSCYAAFEGVAKARADGILDAARGEIAMRLKTGRNIALVNGKISASLLESYFACPYRNFLDNGLKLAERKTGEAAPIDVGTLLHAALEKYTPYSSEGRAGEDKMREIVAEIVSDERYSVFGEKAAGRSLLKRLEREAVSFSQRIDRQYINSDFRLLGTEVEFGRNKKYGAIELSCDGKKYFVEGKVDRVDVSDKYVRVIDYKTGSVDFSDKEFFVGRELQLFLYMNAFLRDNTPAGVYYCRVGNAFSAPDAQKTDFSGYTLDDERVMLATDKDLAALPVKDELVHSDIVKVSKKIIGSTGEVKFSGSGLGSEEMKAYLRYALLLSARAAKQIDDGVIAASPYEGECEFCPYGGVCAFAAVGAEPRSAAAVNKKTITDGVAAESGMSACDDGGKQK